MEIKELNIAGAFELSLPHSVDDRGDFVKILHADTFQELGLATDFKESYYSTSQRGVIRGMHFQIPPHDHEKLVYAVEGKVLDVLLDLRVGSATYGTHCSLELDKASHNAVYIPRGVAHGFGVQEGPATLIYMTTTVYNQDCDTGVMLNSFGFRWPIDDPVISLRDREFEPLSNFHSPF
ncbi:MAG: dTDP-4-dehydrorhamnose 3,5-epimerase family protein [Flavobacteriales bacterium]|nr:dTDP-4-dehydrorhamnose 3,5-epimerase family protein [Flavobacteriales bacterium]